MDTIFKLSDGTDLDLKEIVMVSVAYSTTWSDESKPYTYSFDIIFKNGYKYSYNECDSFPKDKKEGDIIKDERENLIAAWKKIVDNNTIVT